MPLRVSIHSALKASATVTALLGSGTACRHYAGRVPQAPTTPFCVSYEIAGRLAATHGTATDAEDTLDETLIQFSCYAPTLTEAIAVRSAIRAALLDPAEVAAALVLRTAGIVVAGPATREQSEPEVELHCAQLDLTFFHNPNT